MAKMEKQRDEGLGAVVPILINDIDRLNRKFAGLRFGAAGANLAAGGIGGFPGWLLAGVATYEGTASEFGELKAEAEDMVDDLQAELADLATLVNNVRDGGSRSERASQAAAAAKAQRVATSIQEALDKAREARAKAKGAATAAKKLAAANPKLALARASFREASEKLHKFDQDKGAADTQAEFRALETLLKDARTKIDQDLVHLNAAMELVV